MISPAVTRSAQGRALPETPQQGMEPSAGGLPSPPRAPAAARRSPRAGPGRRSAAGEDAPEGRVSAAHGHAPGQPRSKGISSRTSGGKRRIPTAHVSATTAERRGEHSERDLLLAELPVRAPSFGDCPAQGG